MGFGRFTIAPCEAALSIKKLLQYTHTYRHIYIYIREKREEKKGV